MADSKTEEPVTKTKNYVLVDMGDLKTEIEHKAIYEFALRLSALENSPLTAAKALDAACTFLYEGYISEDLFIRADGRKNL